MQEKQRLYIVSCVFLLFLSSCGLRTTPRPQKETVSSSFETLQARYYGEKIRLSWKEVSFSSHSQQKKDSAATFLLVEELTRNPICPTCVLEVVNEQRILLSSSHLIRTENQVFLDLEPVGDRTQSHLFRLTRLADNKGRRAPQLVEAPAYVDFPPLQAPKLHLTRITSNAEEARFYFYLAWKQQREFAEFQFSGSGELVKKERFYRVNVYQKVNENPWSEQALNQTPIQTNFFQSAFSPRFQKLKNDSAKIFVAQTSFNPPSLLDTHPSTFPLKAALYMNYQDVAKEKLFYRIRWVSHTGNESSASETTPFFFPHQTLLEQSLLPKIFD